MQASDKLRTDIGDWVRRTGNSPDNAAFDRLRSIFSRDVPGVPDETLAALFTSFLARYGAGSRGTRTVGAGRDSSKSADSGSSLSEARTQDTASGSGTRTGSNAEKAVDWLCTAGSLLLGDYDGGDLDRSDWEEIRDIVTVDSGEIHIDTLTYVLGQALEHGAI